MTLLFLGTVFGYFSWLFLDWRGYRRELRELQKDLDANKTY